MPTIGDRPLIDQAFHFVKKESDEDQGRRAVGLNEPWSVEEIEGDQDMLSGKNIRGVIRYIDADR